MKGLINAQVFLFLFLYSFIKRVTLAIWRYFNNSLTLLFLNQIIYNLNPLWKRFFIYKITNHWYILYCIIIMNWHLQYYFIIVRKEAERWEKHLYTISPCILNKVSDIHRMSWNSWLSSCNDTPRHGTVSLRE